VKRRAVLTLGAGAAALALAGHRSAFADMEPDAKWEIYRRYRLLIVGQRDDELADAFSATVADVLARFLPASRAQRIRAADTRRVGVLIGTNQQDVAIMAQESAEALLLAKPPFDDIRGVPLRAIVSFGSHLLVCRSDFMDNHAYLLAKTLVEHPHALPTPAGVPQGIVRAQRGSQAFFAGENMPEPA
jgi:hypothetical protein